jgi:two-component system phosphate regulon sensor histidine kinase PhoR
MQHIVSLFEERANRRSVTLDIVFESGLPFVRADRKALEHVLSNLLDNAVKYAGVGKRVVLSARQQEEGVEFSVADDGAGIEPKHLPRLFERFYRVDAGRSRELGGTGLGLSIVKHLVEAMDGMVSVESRVGAGSTFSFTLRRA